MIIMSLPRCGGTRYCMDLSEKTGLKFVGDMSPANVIELGPWKATVKKEIHETNHDQSLSIDEYINALDHPNDYIILANDANHFMLPLADSFILRKNTTNLLRSYANWLLKIKPDMHISFLINMLEQNIAVAKLVYTYVLRHDIIPVWYEEYFNEYPCNTPLLDALPDNDRILRVIESQNINTIVDAIIERNNHVQSN